jgi:predicted Zn-dependent protease with MMP-like domain
VRAIDTTTKNSVVHSFFINAKVQSSYEFDISFTSILMLHNNEIDTNQSNIFTLPSLEEIKKHAQLALACCPGKIQPNAQQIIVIVENYVSDSLLRKLLLDERDRLLGLYRSHAVTVSRKSEVILFRGPLILYALNSRERIEDVVARVTVSEILHKSDFAYLKKQWLTSIKNQSLQW